MSKKLKCFFPTFSSAINNCNKPKMASYCDEFSFDDVFEDASYVQVSVNQIETQINEEDSDYEKITAKELELVEMDLDDLEFMNDNQSMTEEELSQFWKEMSLNRRKTAALLDSIENVIFNKDENSFHNRELLAI